MSQKERIVEEAMQMFVNQGIKSVRMDDIAQSLGVSKRTLYELYGDKEGLLYDAMLRYIDQQHSRWEQQCSEARNVLEAMFAILGHVMDHADKSSCMMENLRKFYPALHEKLMLEAQGRHRDRFRKMLEQGISEGLFIPSFNIDLAITVLYYTSSAIVLRRDVILPDGMTDREAFVQIISTFYRGISTSKGLQVIDEYMARYNPVYLDPSDR